MKERTLLRGGGFFRYLQIGIIYHRNENIGINVLLAGTMDIYTVDCIVDIEDANS